MRRETRTLPAVEARFAMDGEAGQFEGYASIWGEADAFGDVIRPGAFAASLAKRATTGGPALLWQHDPSQPIGTWSELVEDARGLKVTGRLVLETEKGREAWHLLKAGAVNGLSIGFRAVRSERGPHGGRQLVELDLAEISLVTLPAASRARVTSVRHANPALAGFVDAARAAARAIKGT